jgi:uncharacterized membrane protein YecN with MAPEG domain
MHVPSITGFYLAILALIYAVLALQVARLRRDNRVLFGDADNGRLRTAIRVHANFIEYVPIVTLLVALLEMSGLPPTRVHLLMGGLLLARLLHPMGMSARPGSWQFNAGRVGGILLTIAVLVAAAIGGLLRFWPF